jgi:hypothetical protein
LLFTTLLCGCIASYAASGSAAPNPSPDQTFEVTQSDLAGGIAGRLSGSWYWAGPSIVVEVDSGWVTTTISAPQVTVAAVIMENAPQGGSQPIGRSVAIPLGAYQGSLGMAVPLATRLVVPVLHPFDPARHWLFFEFRGLGGDPPEFVLYLCAGSMALDGPARRAPC